MYRHRDTGYTQNLWYNQDSYKYQRSWRGRNIRHAAFVLSLVSRSVPVFSAVLTKHYGAAKLLCLICFMENPEDLNQASRVQASEASPALCYQRNSGG